MPLIPQSSITVETNNPLTPSDAPFQASVGLSGLLNILVRTSQRRANKGLNIARQIPQSLITFETNNPTYNPFTSIAYTETNNPQGSIESKIPQSLATAETTNPVGYEFDQGDFTSFICMETNLFEVSKEAIIPQSSVTMETNDIEGGVFDIKGMPQSSVTMETNLPVASKSNRIPQSYLEMITYNPATPTVIGKLPNASITMETNLFKGLRLYNIWDSAITPESSHYAVVAKVSDITAVGIQFNPSPPASSASLRGALVTGSYTVTLASGTTLNVDNHRPYFQGNQAVFILASGNSLPNDYNFYDYKFVLEYNGTYVSFSLPNVNSLRTQFSGVISQDVMKFVNDRFTNSQSFNFALVDATKENINSNFLINLDFDKNVMIPSSVIYFETNLLVRTGYDQNVPIPSSVITMSTNSFVGEVSYDLWDSSVTAANTNYAVLGKISNVRFIGFEINDNWRLDLTDSIHRFVTQVGFVPNNRKLVINLVSGTIANIKNYGLAIKDGTDKIYIPISNYGSRTNSFNTFASQSIANKIANIQQNNRSVSLAFVNDTKPNLDTTNLRVSLTS